MIDKLVLADGTVYTGRSCGVSGKTRGEIVFTTNMCGYQETLTDPSYYGQLVVMTYPSIGNYGINEYLNQSAKPWISGLIAREFCEQPSHWQSIGSIKEYFIKHKIVALEGIDTRRLTKHLRKYGTMPGLLACGVDLNEVQLIREAKNLVIPTNQVEMVSTSKPYMYNKNGSYHLAVVDLGVKKSILDVLALLDCRLTIYPYNVSAEELLSSGCDGIVFSNGPGNPESIPQTVTTVKNVLNKLPVLGICLGHQVICLALGAGIVKLKFGHRGGNQPVKDLSTGKIIITNQNHSYVVDEHSLIGTGLMVTHRNLNDGTVEGVSSQASSLVSIQYHPEIDYNSTELKDPLGQYLNLVKLKKQLDQQ